MGLETVHESNIPSVHTPRYSLHPVANQTLATKWPKIAITAHLSINNSKTKAVSSLSQLISVKESFL